MWTAIAHNASEDSAKLDECRRWGDDLSQPLKTTHFFSLATFPGEEPWRAGVELESLGLEVIVDDEGTSGGYWHVTAFAEELLSPEAVARRRVQMEDLARRHELRYDGWDRTRTGIEVSGRLTGSSDEPPSRSLFRHAVRSVRRVGSILSSRVRGPR